MSISLNDNDVLEGMNYVFIHDNWFVARSGVERTNHEATAPPIMTCLHSFSSALRLLHVIVSFLIG